jgi:hypothetical protein
MGANAACPPGEHIVNGICVPIGVAPPVLYGNPNTYHYYPYYGYGYADVQPIQPAQARDHVDSVASGVHPPILETGYATLSEIGKEDRAYGLFSYAILANPSQRSAAFLAETFKSTIPIGNLSDNHRNFNVFYVPIQKGKEADFSKAGQADKDNFNKLGEDFGNSMYDFSMARLILTHVCARPERDMVSLCHSDLTGGPYIFTYTAPASNLDVFPPPYLFVDMTKVAEGAFPEWLSAFRAQVKQEDIKDGSWIGTFRLRILNYALKAANLVGPVEGSIRDTINGFIHSANAEPK